MLEPMFVLRIYSHYFKITKIQVKAIQLLYRFCLKYTSKVWIKERGRWITKIEKVYAARTKDGLEYRFNINMLSDFKELLKENYITEASYLIETIPLPEPYKVDIKEQPHRSLRDYQIPIVDYILNFNDNRNKLVDAQTGKGKAQPLTSFIKVPNGWSTMGKMKVGTEIIAKDGTITKVNGVFPQGEKDIYRVTFADGRSTECCGDHLWKIFYVNTTINKRWKIVDTIEMNRLINLHNPRVYIDLIDSEEGTDIDLPIDPYVLGVYLGDGSSISSVTITSPDDFIINEVRKLIPKELLLKDTKRNHPCPCYRFIINKDYIKTRDNLIVNALQELQLFRKISYFKFIPDKYLMASHKQRLHLLQGLMDTDGTIGLEGSVSYSTSSLTLAQNVQYLVRSLGGIASISIKNPTYTYKGEKLAGQINYNINIRYKQPSELFRLPKKKERTNDNNQYASTLKLRVSKIEYIGKQLAQCISIDHHEQLYITNDFIVTHNTSIGLTAISRLGYVTVVIIKPAYIEKWFIDIQEVLQIKPKEIMTVQGGDQLRGLFDMARHGILDSKFILISNRTYANYLKAYETNQFSDEFLEYGCHPDEFYALLRASILLIDEVHQDFHLNFKILLYAHVQLAICMSASLMHHNDFMEQMYEIAFPNANRYKGLELDRYLKVFPINYHFDKPQYIRTTEYGKTTYSHMAFEKSVMRHKGVLNNYVNMIKFWIDYGFIKDYKKGDKVLIFASSIVMCTELTRRFKYIYKQFDVRRYVEDDPYENIINADITVTTILSGGTAIDVPNLRMALLTINVDSIQSNIQSSGRLRKLPDRDVKFFYLYCEQIQKHKDYHHRRRDLLKDRVSLIKELSYNYPI